MSRKPRKAERSPPAGQPGENGDACSLSSVSIPFFQCSVILCWLSIEHSLPAAISLIPMFSANGFVPSRVIVKNSDRTNGQGNSLADFVAIVTLDLLFSPVPKKGIFCQIDQGTCPNVQPDECRIKVSSNGNDSGHSLGNLGLKYVLSMIMSR
jgi:hypothetical protein